MNKITDQDIIDIAKKHGYEYAAVKAVHAVESRGNGFSTWDEGKESSIKTLFEGHSFWSQLKKVGIIPSTIQVGNEDILYPKWTKKWYKGPEGEFERLQKARKIHVDAANKSASWGAFQIMGFNHTSAGYDTIQEMVDDYETGEKAHLDSFIKLIQSPDFKLGECLKSHTTQVFMIDGKPVNRWAYFAYKYNGKGYKENNYDVELEKAYKKALIIKE